MYPTLNHVCDKRIEHFNFISDYFGLKFTDKSFKDPNLKVHALYEDETLVAVLLIKKKQNNLYRITFIRVSEEHKGKRYGHTLVDIAIHQAIKEHKDPIQVLTRVKVDNLASLNFFISEGFKMHKLESITNSYLDRGIVVAETSLAYLMTKDFPLD